MNKKEQARSIFEAMNTKEFDLFEKNVHEDVSFDFPGINRIVGAKRIILFFKALLRKYTKLNFIVSDVIVEEEMACAIWTNKGEYNNGDDYANSGMTLFHFADGRITYISDYFKDTSFIKRK